MALIADKLLVMPGNEELRDKLATLVRAITEQLKKIEEVCPFLFVMSANVCMHSHALSPVHVTCSCSSQLSLSSSLLFFWHTEIMGYEVRDGVTYRSLPFAHTLSPMAYKLRRYDNHTYIHT